MESGAALFILIAALLVIGVPILSIVAYARVGAVKREAEAEAAQLIRRIYALEQRLSQIEKGLSALTVSGAAAAPRAPSETPVTTVQPHIPAAPPVAASAPPVRPERPPVVPAPATPSAPPMHTTVPVREHAPVISQAMYSSTTTSRGDEGNFEAVFAGRWLNYVGILALLFAVTFFLKYAFDNNWVGPRGRIGIGLLAGSALYPWSQHLLARGYKYFSEGIAGLGAAVLYLSLWAGWHYYHIFPQVHRVRG